MFHVALLILFSWKTSADVVSAEFWHLSFRPIKLSNIALSIWNVEMQCRFYTLKSLFRVEICVNKEDATEFWNWYGNLFSIPDEIEKKNIGQPLKSDHWHLPICPADNELCCPWAVSADEDNHIYIADGWNERVLVLHTSG